MHKPRLLEYFHSWPVENHFSEGTPSNGESGTIDFLGLAAWVMRDAGSREKSRRANRNLISSSPRIVSVGGKGYREIPEIDATMRVISFTVENRFIGKRAILDLLVVSSVRLQ